MSKVLIVDDQDRSIQYSGSWSSENNVGDYTNEYLNTVHKSNTVGDSLEYSFVGTGISVFGTLNTPRSLGLPTPRFTIDNNDSTAFNASGEVLNWDRSRQVSHALLYKSPTLPKGNHTIKIAIASPSGTTSTTPGPFYLDFFTVDSGSDSVAGDVLLDDRDQSLLFSGSWQNAGIVEEYMGTTRQSPDANAGTMTLQFNGTAITVYGTTAQTINFGTTKISFNVDGQSTTFEGKPNLPAVLHQAVFQATSLGADKTHTLTITPLNSNPLFLDYFVYRTTNSSATTSTNTPNDHKTSNTGAIVGGVVGVVAIVLLALLGFFLWRRRRARKDNEPGHAGGTADYAGVAEPYRVPANGSQYTAVPFGSMSNIPASKNIPNNRASEVQSSFYDGDGNSTAYTGVDTHFTVSDFRSAGSDISGVNGPNANVRHVPGGTILYPQFEGVNSRPPPRSPVAPPSATYPPIPGGTYGQSEKSRFMQMDRHPPSPSRVPATAHPPESTVVSSSPPSSSFEVDSGLRIPRASPPMYTED